MPLTSTNAAMPTRVYGIDFSGAKDAGRRIWITKARIADGGLHVEHCTCAASLRGSRPDRDAALRALRDFIRGLGDCAIGLDFPFGLPREIGEHDAWVAFLRNFAATYVDPQAFQIDCKRKQADIEAKKELRRQTDDDAKTPFSPYFKWIYRQTYFGLHDILAPLVEADEVSVLPMQRACPGRPWLFEICPASTLKRFYVDWQFYKGGMVKQRETRRKTRTSILDQICQREHVELSPSSLRTVIIEDIEGDALDSVLAACAAARAVRDPVPHVPVDKIALYAVEGWVYV